MFLRAKVRPMQLRNCCCVAEGLFSHMQLRSRERCTDSGEYVKTLKQPWPDSCARTMTESLGTEMHAPVNGTYVGEMIPPIPCLLPLLSSSFMRSKTEVRNGGLINFSLTICVHLNLVPLSRDKLSKTGYAVQGLHRCHFSPAWHEKEIQAS